MKVYILYSNFTIANLLLMMIMVTVKTPCSISHGNELKLDVIINIKKIIINIFNELNKSLDSI